MIQEEASMRVRLVTKSVLSAALVTGATGFLVMAPVGVGAASAMPPPTVSRIAPVSAPAGSSVPIVIRGHRFDTTAGMTTVTFNGTPAVSVSCPAPGKCTAVTPDLPVGNVSVIVTTDGVPLNPENLTVTAYAAPVVRMLLNARGHTIFSVSRITDSYPAQGAPGFAAVTITNTTAGDQTLTGPLVPTTLIPAGTSQTFALANNGGPYVFFGSTSPTPALTVQVP